MNDDKNKDKKKDKKPVAEDKKVPADDKTPPKTLDRKGRVKSCWNCDEIFETNDDFHYISSCPKLCKIHKKDCDSKKQSSLKLT